MVGDYETMIDKVMYYMAHVTAERTRKINKRVKRTCQINETFDLKLLTLTKMYRVMQGVSLLRRVPRKKPKQESELESLESAE